MTDITLRCTAPNVGVDVVSPTHDMKLTDEAGNSVGLIYCDRYGRRNPVGVNTGNMPRSPIRISTGSTGYSDQEPPFITEVQSTWVGGRAQADPRMTVQGLQTASGLTPQSSSLFAPLP